MHPRTNETRRTKRPGIASRAMGAIAATLLGAVLIVAGGPEPAYAACTSPVDPASAMRQADTVFVGRVAELDDFGRLATMQVLEIWKGPELPARVVVNGSFSGSNQVGPSDRTFTMGGTYLVVPFGSRSPFFDEACSGTSLFSPLGGAIPPQFQAAVGATAGRVVGGIEAAPADDASGGALNPGLLVGAGALLLVGLTYVVAKARRGRAAGSGEGRRSPGGTPGGRDKGTEGAGGVVGSLSRVRAKRQKVRRRRQRVRQSQGDAKARRFSRSGLDNLETIRKKTRRVKKSRMRKNRVKIRHVKKAEKRHAKEMREEERQLKKAEKRRPKKRHVKKAEKRHAKEIREEERAREKAEKRLAKKRGVKKRDINKRRRTRV